ncbi:glycoside hydrolase family 43 protein [Neolewinella lacunae]|uniref:Family 43 glycosylhydrolase n=1 Tax=Neolewinella lacunae TaxID=1517758 RepID=A0A923PNW2_9BACT|nr:glycoside hydrolase family 43 protein [Neolewinella lacunae]MBC6995116.1 family 43 glycosylhydrolase [Neolewinella lacunae]MDN3634066.1 glycoside hydrolase family 43 protein [Neolewinella lacunae]
MPIRSANGNYRALSLSSFFVLLVFALGSCQNNKEANESADQTAQDTAATFQNPLDVEFGDPYILDDGSGTYYMYGTGGGAVDGFSVYSSKDLVNWNYENQVYHGNTADSWNESAFWAPECYFFDGKYYLFYSANWKHNPTNEGENFHIGVAVADDPKGPFEDLQNKPLFEPGYPIIDANVFRDDDGKFYLYYSRACYKHPVESEVADWAKAEGLFDEIEESWVYGVELSPDFKSVIGEPVLLLRPPVKMDDANAEWESRSVTSGEVNRRWTEGSFTFKHQGTYYMMYSANFYAGENYAVGYSTATAPLGPYTKADNNPVLQKNVAEGGEVTGTGHNSVLFLEDQGKMYSVYHGRTQSTGEERVVFIDEMTIDANGKLEVAGPTTSPQPMIITDSK